MPDNKLPPHFPPSTPSGMAVPPNSHVASNSKQNSHAPGKDGAAHADMREQLKQRLDETRLPADVREQILAGLPSPEELERQYREMQEHGGLSSDQFLDSLGLEVEPQP